ncbi:MAG: RimK family alpha-L-glutamate ligase, partial [Halohasta sp.]
MLRLALSTAAETFDRIREPLADRDIEVGHLQAKGRSIRLTGREPVDPTDEFDVGFVFPGRLMEGAAVDAIHDLPWVNGREAVLTSRNKGGV